MVLQALLLVLKIINPQAIGLSSCGIWIKNRPLPPGEAFDPYRKKDFQRRKAEGFPPPLYPSYIDTPEDSESQKELSQLHREEKQKRLEKKRRKRKDK